MLFIIFIQKLMQKISIIIPKKSKKVVAFVDYIDNQEIAANDNAFLMGKYLEDRGYEVIYINNKYFHKVYLDKIISRVWNLLTAEIILTKFIPTKYFYSKNQKVITTGYFTPFKADRLTEYYAKEKYGKLVYRYFELCNTLLNKQSYYYITTSRYTSIMTAVSHNVDIRHFRELGMPRNDIFFNKKQHDIRIEEIFNLNKKPDKVFIYTPTFRDCKVYESVKDFKKYDELELGYEGCRQKLETILEKTNSIIIFKLHKYYDEYKELEKSISNKLPKNCYLWSDEIEVQYNSSIYDLFEISDCMICDYSSIVFDYLLVNKPIIYNVYDWQDYNMYRGVSFEPMEMMMPGDICKNEEELFYAIRNVINNKDQHREDRERVNYVVNYSQTEATCEKIYKEIICK